MSGQAVLETPPELTARPAYRVTGPRVLRAEWAKFWALRSTWITLGLALLFLIGLGVLSAVHYSSDPGTRHLGPSRPTDAVGVALGGQGLAQLAIGVLGVLLTAGEYSTGMIRSTLTAVPRRLPMLWSKTVVYAVVVLVLATAAVFLSFLGGRHPLAGTRIATDLSAPGVLRCLFGAGGYFALVGVVGVALGALIRSIAGGIATLVVGLMLLPVLIEVLPSNVCDDMSPYLPGNAGSAIFALQHGPGLLSPVEGLAVFAGWAALALVGAAWRLVRTDV
ncbi:ABC transporter permease [Streptomyces sp. NBC_01190]|uniref:ABC transporter permease n=1 Tax=Streptomyces sp. NBC_01190 TaxID=2903767 RepID=UPI003869CB98|nr:ABC transporter permease [Streptomyces sp. NBC_01190]